VVEALEAAQPGAQRQVRCNYHLLQVFDLMSLYLCCDGYDDQGMRPATFAPVPKALDGEIVNLTLTPLGGDAIRVEPYPFDRPSFQVSVMARAMRNAPGRGVEACRLAYLGGERRPLTWTMTR
jgi:hypothetical protein